MVGYYQLHYGGSPGKSVLGRHLNTLSRVIVEEDVNGANDRLASMKLTFEELEVWHYNYLEFLEMYDDGSSDDVDKCNDWFLDVTKFYLDEVAKARRFLKQHRVTGQTERAENDARGIYENQVGSGGLCEELATHSACLRSKFLFSVVTHGNIICLSLRSIKL